jgi:hypothetical protein
MCCASLALPFQIPTNSSVVSYPTLNVVNCVVNGYKRFVVFIFILGRMNFPFHERPVPFEVTAFDRVPKLYNFKGTGKSVTSVEA